MRKKAVKKTVFWSLGSTENWKTNRQTMALNGEIVKMSFLETRLSEGYHAEITGLGEWSFLVCIQKFWTKFDIGN